MTRERGQPPLVPVLALACLAALGLASQPAAAGTTSARAGQQRAQEPTLDPLLERFPIGTERVRAFEQSGSGASNATTLAEPGSAETGRTLWILLAGTGVIVLLNVSGATAFWWRRRTSIWNRFPEHVLACAVPQCACPSNRKEPSSGRAPEGPRPPAAHG